MANFAVSGYVQHLVALPFGSNMNRLVGGRLLGNIPMANFGFATSLYEYMKRYPSCNWLVSCSTCSFCKAETAAVYFAIMRAVKASLLFSVSFSEFTLFCSALLACSFSPKVISASLLI